MSTNSTISMKYEDGVVGVYCHWDGYPENNGNVLKDHYSNHNALVKLLKKGDMSSLESDPRDIEYYVDRGEKGTGPTQAFSFEEFLSKKGEQEFNYYWDGTEWFLKPYGQEKVNLDDYVRDLEDEDEDNDWAADDVREDIDPEINAILKNLPKDD